MDNRQIYILVDIFLYTVNVDIFACINFRGFDKMGNFARIKIRVFSILCSLSYDKCIFHVEYIFAHF